ncbi:MAG TPA: PRC-barrel domain-containing protein [Chloroflexota bacterium]|nr:PRC-barrel domain-containing protein [Chloroflexota bacterium]
MIRSDFDGAALIDSAGERIGTVERTFVDDNGNPRFLKVRMGHLPPRHRLVPAEQAETEDDGVRVPYLRDVIEESPPAAMDDNLSGDELTRIQEYYASDV